MNQCTDWEGSSAEACLECLQVKGSDEGENPGEWIRFGLYRRVHGDSR